MGGVLDALKKNPVEAARAEVLRLHGLELSWSTSLQAKREALTACEWRRGEDVLRALDRAESEADPEQAAVSHARALAQDIATLKTDIDTAQRLITATRERRRSAILACSQAEAHEDRARAAQLRKDADKHGEKTAKQLAELREHEGCDYAPAAPTESSRPHASPGAPFVVHVPTPRSELLRLQANDHERQALQLEQRRVPDHGQVSATSIDELIAAATADPMKIGPTVVDIRAWATDAEAALRQRDARASANGVRRLPEDAPVRFVLAWRHGEVDPAQSRCELPPRPPTPLQPWERLATVSPLPRPPSRDVVLQ